MKRTLVAAALAVAVLASLPVARAADQGDQKFTVSGELRSRMDDLNNYFDFNNDTNNNTPSDHFNLWPYRARVNISGRLADNVSVEFDVQNVGAFGNQSPNLSDATFFGPVYQNSDGDGLSGGLRSSETSLYQAYIALDQVGGSKLNLMLGRQEFELGTGLILGNEEFYNGTTFDGLKGVYSWRKFALTGLYFNTAERNDQSAIFFPSAGGTQDTNLYGFVGGWKFENKLESNVDAYVMRFRDFAAGNPGNLDMMVYGGHWWRTNKTQADAKKHHLDWNLEIAAESGSARFQPNGGEPDVSGSVIDGSIGWTFTPGNVMHRIFAGGIAQSGDKDLTDNKLEGWVALYPSVHGRFGNADFFGANFSIDGNAGFFGAGSGIMASRMGYVFTSKDAKHKAGATLWAFDPSEDEVKVAPGVTNKIDDFGSEYDVWYKYLYSMNVQMGVNISQLMPDDGLAGGGGAPDDAVTRIYGQVRVLFP